MNKIIRNMLLLFAAGASALTTTSCSDDDNVAGTNTDRQFMTMFITDYTRGKGSDYPYNCGLDGAYPHGNTIHLYWYGVKEEMGCAGYQIQMALQNKVSLGAEAWAKIQGTSDLLLDTIVGPDVLDLLIPDLQYSSNYRFAIRALSTRDENIKGNEGTFAHASNWYGHGNGRQWQEYLNIPTNNRYETPFAVYVDQSLTTENTMRVCINSNIKTFIAEFENYTTVIGDAIDALNPITMDGVVNAFGGALTATDKDKLESYFVNFNVEPDGQFGFTHLTVEPSPNNPNSTVGSKWVNYEITDADRQRGYIDIDGLSANSVYVINVVDPTIKVAIDAKYNTCTSRSDGTPGAPILLKHDSLLLAYGTSRADTFALAADYNAVPISPQLYSFISDTKYAEGQTFMLEGGKTYYIDGNDVTCKGFVLRTNPADVAQGKRAKVICGIGKNAFYNQGVNGEQWQGSFSLFMFGRSPEAGEGGEIYMKKLAFYDIDFDCPKALNYGDQQAGIGKVAGNYFFNMFSDGMAVTLDSLVIENCTFKRIVRGFIREQGPNYKKWNHVLITGNQFFDCGFYNNAAGGYPMIAGSGSNAQTNLYLDCKVTENTFYDSPFPSFFCEENTTQRLGGAWNITFSNNTLVNFNTRASGAIFKMRSLPNGSVYNVENNLFVLTKQPGDVRVLGFWGADIRDTEINETTGEAGIVTLNFNNNWSTNDNLTGGSIFSSNAWTSTSNNFGKLLKNGNAELNGSLDVDVADISSTDLFVQPCPPHKATTASDRNMHRADALDGTAAEYNVNLYIKDTSKEIKPGIGASRWYR